MVCALTTTAAMLDAMRLKMTSIIVAMYAARGKAARASSANSMRWPYRELPGSSATALARYSDATPDRKEKRKKRNVGHSQPAAWNRPGICTMPGPVIDPNIRHTLENQPIVLPPKPASGAAGASTPGGGALDARPAARGLPSREVRSSDGSKAAASADASGGRLPPKEKKVDMAAAAARASDVVVGGLVRR